MSGRSDRRASKRERRSVDSRGGLPPDTVRMVADPFRVGPWADLVEVNPKPRSPDDPYSPYKGEPDESWTPSPEVAAIMERVLRESLDSLEDEEESDE